MEKLHLNSNLKQVYLVDAFYSPNITNIDFEIGELHYLYHYLDCYFALQWSHREGC